MSERLLNYTQHETEKLSMTQSKSTTLITQLADDSEAQNRAKRIKLLNQQITELSLEQHLAALKRLDGWMASPWVLSGLGIAAGIALFCFGVLFTKFVVLAH